MVAIANLVTRSSLNHNPPNADFHVSNHGTNYLWALFAIFLLSMFGMFALTFLVRVLV